MEKSTVSSANDSKEKGVSLLRGLIHYLLLRNNSDHIWVTLFDKCVSSWNTGNCGACLSRGKGTWEILTVLSEIKKKSPRYVRTYGSVRMSERTLHDYPAFTSCSPAHTHVHSHRWVTILLWGGQLGLIYPTKILQEESRNKVLLKTILTLRGYYTTSDKFSTLILLQDFRRNESPH